MKRTVIFIILVIIFVGYVHFTTANGEFEPLGRLAFVKLANPDMYPGHPHSRLLAEYARSHGSKCALVVHYGGSSNYRSYMEGDILILQLAYVEKKPYTPGINWSEVWEEGINGVPADKWTYRSDGIEFQTLDEALAYIRERARENGQDGPIPLVYHGTVREGDIVINQGCGFPLYYHIIRSQYGPLGAYYYVIKGFFYPYIYNPYRNFEIKNAEALQYYYTHNMLNYE
ncbi:MAG: hypothetical protein H5T38_03550 [Methanobacteriaceae archaeon]|nr:hypothetical protein [Methanobacteriaceae archaeon]